MTNAFIANADEKKLANLITDLCASSDRFDMLVGYFYFSAIGSIADAMFEDPNRKMRVLVGLEAENGTSDAIALGGEESVGGSKEEKYAAFTKRRRAKRETRGVFRLAEANASLKTTPFSPVARRPRWPMFPPPAVRSL